MMTDYPHSNVEIRYNLQANLKSLALETQCTLAKKCQSSQEVRNFYEYLSIAKGILPQFYALSKAVVLFT